MDSTDETSVTTQSTVEIEPATTDVEVIDKTKCESAVGIAPRPMPTVATCQTPKVHPLGTCVHVLSAIGASMFLVFTCLAVSVHHTFPGFTLKYRPSHGTFQNPLAFPGHTFYPNGTVELMPGYDLMANDEVIASIRPEGMALNDRLIQVARFGPTIFPILFAGIIGSSLRLLARWRAEKGSSIERLEVLIGSTSLASTLSTLLLLGTIGITEIGLIFLWALSPLAGQASLRVLETRNVTDSAAITATWSGGSNNDYDLPTRSNWLPHLYVRYITAMDSYQSLDSSTNAIGPRDWNSCPLIPQIPIQDTWTRSTWQNSSLEFNSTREQESEMNFTSLVGFIVFGPTLQISSEDTLGTSGFNLYTPPFSLDTRLNFTIDYYEFNCPSVSQYSIQDSWTSFLGSHFIYSNSSALVEQAQSGSGFFLDTNYTFGQETNIDVAQYITFGSFHNSNVTLWTCQIYTVSRNINLFYWSLSQVPSGSATMLQSVDLANVTTTTPFTNYGLASSLFSQWPAMDAATLGASSITEQYLAEGYNSYGNSLNRSLVDLSVLDNTTFATRLTTIFNTYMQTIPNCTGVDSDYGSNNLPIWVETNNCALNATSSTPVQFLPFVLVACNWTFVTILALTSTLLLICACLNIWLSRNLSTPDMIGYVSSLAIQNPYVSIHDQTPGANTALDGLSRAKLLKDVKVQIRDIQEEEKVGKFVLTSDIRKRQRAGKDRKFI